MKRESSWTQKLSRRERQVMEILLSAGEATAAEIHRLLPEPPGYSAVRALLRVMEEKGVLIHKSDGPRYVYKPAMPSARARQSILRQVLENLFQGSREQLVAALLDSGTARLSREELDRIAAQVEAARRAGR